MAILTGSKRDAFRSPNSASARLFERAREALPGGNSRTTVYSSPFPPYVAHGQGATITDVEGEDRLDFLNNYTSLIHGHADPDINAAVIDQLGRGVSFAMPTEGEIALAEVLDERIPSIERIRFTNSGTEGVMMAIKAARAYTGRPKIAKFEGCYHGSYDFAEVSTSPPEETWGEGDPVSLPVAAGTPPAVLDNVVVLPFNDLEATERLIGQHRNELAAVLIDPMPRSVGLVPAEPEFLRRLRTITREYGIVLIFDEVISFRVAAGGTQSVLGVTPDLTAMGKIIGGGFPVGAVGGSAEVMSVFDPTDGPPKVPHGGTFNANPVTVAAGLVAMGKMTPDAYARLKHLTERLRQGTVAAMADAGIRGQVTGLGSLFMIHLHDRPIRDYRSSVGTPAERQRGAAIFRSLHDHGIITAPALFGCLSTPMRDEHVDTFIEAFATALRETAVE